VRIVGAGTKSSLLPEAVTQLSTQAFRGICAYVPDDLYVTVRAGTRLEELQQELRRKGTQVPLASPWPQSTVGGIVSSNFNAPWRCLYGGLRDLVLAVTAALPDGRIVRIGRPFVKDVAGYDLKKLFIGAHGTLGVLDEVTLRLFPLPRLRRSLIVPAPDLRSALARTRLIRGIYRVGSGLLVGRSLPCGPSGAPYTVVFTLEGLAEDVDFETSAVLACLAEHGVADILQTSDWPAANLWAEFLGNPTESEATVRIGVPFRALPQMLELVEGRGTQVKYLADAANSLIYLRVPCRDAAFGPLFRAARDGGGYALITGGPAGRFSRDDIWGYDPDSRGLMRALKQRWDPSNLLNPGVLM
jgi:D-lactate dehydrogenase (cytochrome)